jgi:hypothetical protein
MHWSGIETGLPRRDVGDWPPKTRQKGPPKRRNELIILHGVRIRKLIAWEVPAVKFELPNYKKKNTEVQNFCAYNLKLTLQFKQINKL